MADFQARNEWDENKHPRGEDGKFGSGGKEERVNAEKISKIKIDFTKDNILPELNPEDLEYLGVESKPVRLKKNIIARNSKLHSDIKENEAAGLIGKALYSPEYIIPGKRAGSFHFISKNETRESPLVLLDIEQSEDGYFDIVHFFKVRERGKRALLK